MYVTLILTFVIYLSQFLLPRRSTNINTRSIRKEKKQKMNLAEKREREINPKARIKNVSMNQRRDL